MPDPSGESLPHLRWSAQPDLPDGPILVAAFGGWNDAGDAATTAVDHLEEQWGSRPFVDIDPEDFFDFTSTRPEVRIDIDGRRRIEWPANVFRAGTTPEGLGVVTLSGVEPQLRWRTFCDHVLGVAVAVGARTVVTLGALLAEVPHSRPVSIFGTAYDPDDAVALDLLPSRYEGPTGITGVLHSSCSDLGIRSAAFWAAVPTYVPSAPSPKAALALAQRVSLMLGTTPDFTELKFATDAYEHQVSELVAEDDETTDYVAHLEHRYDEEPDSFTDGESLVDEVERFLRDQD
jgi:predicted ATP-grasp superfamily ATP-dependent carboligase